MPTVPSAVRPKRSVRRQVLRIAAGVGIVLAVGLAGGLIVQSVAESGDLRRYRPAGELLDVDGRKTHLHCTGAGAPVVLLESGLGGPALQWTLVQAQLQNTMTVCSYDRAGIGWSEPGTRPRTSRQMAGELHRLLEVAGRKGPYLLVGHSLGGLNVRVFAHDYPQEVLGIVLVASGSENETVRMPPEYPRIEQANLRTDRLLTWIGRFGVLRLLQNGKMFASFADLTARFPAERRAELLALTLLRPSYWATASQELAAAEESRAQVAATGSLGALPLVVLSGSPDFSRLPPTFPVAAIERTAKDLQDELARLSSRSLHLTCAGCDHYIPMTSPDRVVEAVDSLLKFLPR